MKYLLVVPDGVADLPLPELGGKTPLEKANTPHMDRLVKQGTLGRVQTVPKELPSGSDVAGMSLLGYDPKRYYTGRAPLEAAGRGISLKDGEVAFRCNLVTIQDGKMQDYSAGHISSEEAGLLIEALQKELGNEHFRFYPGVQYRHILITTAEYKDVRCTPPHDIAEKKISLYDPEGNGSEALKVLMASSEGILSEQPVNQKRIDAGKLPATQIWLWGQGTKPNLPSFKEQYGLSGSVISAVDLVRGVGASIGLEVLNVPGATGYFDTNYRGKAQAALNALSKKDFVLVHVESTDEAGHMGNATLKIKAIEDFDREVVGTLLEGAVRFKEIAILLLPDHTTSTAVRTHTHDPVPFAVYGTGIAANGFSAYNETEAARSGLWIGEGFTLMKRFLQKGF